MPFLLSIREIKSECRVMLLLLLLRTAAVDLLYRGAISATQTRLKSGLLLPVLPRSLEIQRLSRDTGPPPPIDATSASSAR